MIKGVWDTFVKIQSNFRDTVIQSFLNLGFGDICPFLFRVMGYFSK